MRGKQDAGLPLDGLIGLIPARAGKTTWSSLAIAKRSAHPRACGENREIEYFGWYEQGSSPRVRGKRRYTYENQRWKRLIPARAGKTLNDLEF